MEPRGTTHHRGTTDHRGTTASPVTQTSWSSHQPAQGGHNQLATLLLAVLTAATTLATALVSPSWTAAAAAAATLLALNLWTRTLASRTEAGFAPTPASPSTYVRIRGGTVRYTTAGHPDTPPVILLHGIGLSLDDWGAPLIDDLAKDHYLVLMDRPGCGFSKRTDTAALANQARMVRDAWTHALGPHRKPVLAGHSLGGLLSLTIASLYPHDVAGLALIAPATCITPTPPSVLPPYLPFRLLQNLPDAARWLLAHTVAAPLTALNTTKHLQHIFHPDPVIPTFLRHGTPSYLRPQTILAFLQDLAAVAHDLHSAQHRWNLIPPHIPTHVLYGTHDTVLSAKPHTNHIAHTMPQARITLLDARGHMLPITAPHETAACVRTVVTTASATGPR